MYRLFTLIILMFISVPISALGFSADGNQLLEHCSATLNENSSSEDYQRASFCRGLLWGVVMTHSTLVALKNSDKYFCLPKGIIINQGAKIVVKYLNEHPAFLHKGDVALVISAFADAFPCDNQSPQ